jgi:hypothetical protein
MIVICVTLGYSAFGSDWNLVSGVFLEVEQAALPILCVFAIGLFYATEESNVGQYLD